MGSEAVKGGADSVRGRRRATGLIWPSVLAALLTACPKGQATTPPTGASGIAGNSGTPRGQGSQVVDPDDWVPPPGVRPEEGSYAEHQATDPSENPEAVPTLNWKQRMAIDVDSFKRDDAMRYIKVKTAIPESGDADDPEFIALLSSDPRSAGVILQRLMSAVEPLEVRAALAEQLPYTRGDWQEGAAVLIRIDPDAAVRKALVETMRYAESPHAAEGLRRGLGDEAAAVRSAAARIAGFVPDASRIEEDLLARLKKDRDWETRAAVAHSLGALELRSAFLSLTEALADRDPRVQVAALVALERIDVVAAAALDQVKALRRSPEARVSAAARRLIQRGKRARAPVAE